ncbi:ABC transporter permease [bacterium BMS3Abin03]|jgi:ABC-2 type transport system permease protein|nr:ABC transporter permease [bacterium BMS3Abin03]MCG6960117.1 ABC transporter permease [bacterium BMS3Abin03]
MIRRIFALAKKEFRELSRDVRMLFVLFAFPIILLGIFGYAITFDVHHIKVAVYDQEKSDLTREFINNITSSDYFDVVGYINSENEIRTALDDRDAQCVIVFPSDMSRKLYTGEEAKIQVLVDGINANSASIIINYINSATSSFSQSFVKEVMAVNGIKPYVPIDPQPVFWFNPELNSTFFLLPGLIAFILIITAVVSIALSIVREKERGTIEQINVSHISYIELLIGKTLPYTIIALIISALVLTAGHILFGITVQGSYFLLFFTTLIFLFAALNLGIFVSTVADSQQVAFQIATLVSMLPAVILSGFIFPIESMPPFIQILTNVTPAKFYIVILRDIMLKGVGISAFWDQIIYLLIFAFVFLTLSTLIGKKTRAV